MRAPAPAEAASWRRVRRPRRLADRAMKVFCAAVTALGVFALGWILLLLAWEGLTAFSPTIFTEVTPGPGSEGGGLANAIVGSIILTFLGITVATPIGVLAGTYLSEYGKSSQLANVIRFVNDILLSAPSILIGLFVYTLIVWPTGGFSGWAGAVALAIIAMPVIVRTTEDMLRLVPNTLREAGAALGAPPAQVMMQISWRAAKAGIVTGILLAMARIAGETAPLLFTALNNSFWFNASLLGGVANLPVTIFQFALSPYPNWQKLAWAGALLITVAILALSVVARLLVQKGDHDDEPRRHGGAERRRKPICRRAYGSPAGTSTSSTASSRRSRTSTSTFYDRQVTALIGPSGCGKSTLLRCFNRMYSLYPEQRAEGEIILDGHNILSNAHRRERAALAHRHGVPEADAVPDVDLRQRRLRPAPLREARRAPSSTSASRSALRKAALWDEVKDKLRQSGMGLSGGQQQRLCIARAIAQRPGGHPLRRADLGARSDLDRQDRGADRAAAHRVHHRHRHAQHAAGGAHLAVHRLHVSRRADRVRRHRPGSS